MLDNNNIKSKFVTLLYQLDDQENIIINDNNNLNNQINHESTMTLDYKFLGLFELDDFLLTYNGRMYPRHLNTNQIKHLAAEVITEMAAICNLVPVSILIIIIIIINK